MANTKEVRKQIASIKSTQKITSAMEMVAASKMSNQTITLSGAVTGSGTTSITTTLSTIDGGTY